MFVLIIICIIVNIIDYDVCLELDDIGMEVLNF